MPARIFQPAKNAMQSGKVNTRVWVFEFEPESAKPIDPLMGNAGSSDTSAQIQLKFKTQQEAEAYAERLGIAYQVYAPQKPKPVVKTYADNFKFGRIGQWTH